MNQPKEEMNQPKEEMTAPNKNEFKIEKLVKVCFRQSGFSKGIGESEWEGFDIEGKENYIWSK